MSLWTPPYMDSIINLSRNISFGSQTDFKPDCLILSKVSCHVFKKPQLTSFKLQSQTKLIKKCQFPVQILIVDNIHFDCIKWKTGLPSPPSINIEHGKTLLHIGVYQGGTQLL